MTVRLYSANAVNATVVVDIGAQKRRNREGDTHNSSVGSALESSESSTRTLFARKAAFLGLIMVARIMRWSKMCVDLAWCVHRHGPHHVLPTARTVDAASHIRPVLFDVVSPPSEFTRYGHYA